MLSLLKGSMRRLREGCKVLPSLESAVGTLLEALDCIEITEQSDRELQDMVSDLPQWTLILSAYLSDTQPEGISKWVKQLAGVLLEQAEYIKSKQQAGLMRRLAGSKQEIEELQRIHRHIETSFRQLQTETGLSTWKITDDHFKAPHNARYDSSFADKIERGGCFENTRVSVLEGIRIWIDAVSDAKIYWTNGMAGTGKTTIAYSICMELEQSGRLGASYFCSRASSECRDVGRILPTIAYQLAQQFYPFRSALCRALGERPNIGQRKISVQFENLIKNPLLEVKDVLPSRVVVVIDALDECSDPKATEQILNTLLSHAANLPIRFFLTSRPEPSILNAILCPIRGDKSRSVLHLHNVEEQFVKADIETYMTVALARLSLTVDQIKQLAQQAGILFIYAATVVRYLLAAGRGANASTRLKTVLTESTARINKKYQEIDGLYKAILGEVLEDKELEVDEVEAIKRVLWTVVCAREPVTKGVLAALLKVDHEQVISALQPLQSVLRVSEGDEVVSVLHASFPDFMLNPERSGPLICCNERDHSGYLARRCFEIMKQELRFNICDLETSYRFDQDVPDLKDRVVASISPELFYASRYWAEHLRHSTICDELISCLKSFLYRRLLFWMEVLNLKGCMDNGPNILTEAHTWLPKSDEVSETRKFAHDARSFVIIFAANPVRRSTPHIYLSVLPFMSRQSELWEAYWERTQGLIRMDGSLIDQVGAALAVWVVQPPKSSQGNQVVPGESHIPWRYTYAALQVDLRRKRLLIPPKYGVTCMALSPDGTRIAFGNDCTIQMYGAHSGTPLGRPLKGHTENIICIVFSPNGTHIASGSYDCSIRVWDVDSGTLFAGPFEGHTDWVTSVAFSSDGTHIISSSVDGTVLEWDMVSGSSTTEATFNPYSAPLLGDGSHRYHEFSVAASFVLSSDGLRVASSYLNRPAIQVWSLSSGTLLAGPLEGHTDIVLSIAFSPSRTSIVSGSRDQTIRVWDVRSGTMLADPFRGHQGGVTAVAFSPSGTRIVSGSSDRTVRVWDLSSGTMLAGPFQGHSCDIACVVVPPDDTRIISGSSDYTIRVWDIHGGIRLGSSFNGHTQSITSVAFSPDNHRILSGSFDSTTRTWNAYNGTFARLFHGHDRGRQVTSVAFSPDGTRIISGSADCTIRMWNAHSGIPLSGPFEGHTKPVRSVAFSPDGGHVASGSDDCTIWVWHARGGTTPVSPLKGHTKPVTSVAFSSDGTRITSGSSDCTVRVWDVKRGTCFAGPFEGHVKPVTSVTFSPDGVRIASGSHDYTVRVWDMHGAAILLEGHTRAVTSVAFSPDGTRIVSGSDDYTIRLWDVRSGAPSASPFKGHTGRVTSVSFSSDGTRIVSGSWDGTIRVWEILSQRYPLTSTFGTWVVDNEGWAMDSVYRSPLLWLPIGLRDVFPHPPTELIIRPEGSIKTLWTDTLLVGESWDQCYDSAL